MSIIRRKTVEDGSATAAKASLPVGLFVSPMGQVVLCGFVSLILFVGNVYSARAQQNLKERIEEMGVQEYKRQVAAGLIQGPDTSVNRRPVSGEHSLIPKATGDSTSQLKVPLDSTFSVVQFDGEGGTGQADPDDPLQRNDDDVTDSIDVGFEYNFYGIRDSIVFINNNGNVTIDGPQSAFEPVGFPSDNYTMIAPFWADVDTQNDSSGVVYQRIDPNQIVVTWNGVGYYNNNADKLNKFQVILSNGEGEDVPPGKNLCFSYANMQWTTGDASGGTDGFGGDPATAGVNKGDGSTFALVGRFDKDGDSYDGPGGNADGVDYLDGRQVCFDTRTESNNLPPTAQNVPSDPTAIVGDTTSGSLEFLSPETNQITSVTVSEQPANFQVTTTDGNPATVDYTFAPTSEQAGQSFVVSFTATDDGDPAQSTTLDLTFDVPLSSPNNLTATSGIGQIELSWNAINAATLAGYNLYRSTSSFSDPSETTRLNSVLLGDTSYVDETVTSDTTYHYRVTAVDESGNESMTSNEVRAAAAGAPTVETDSVSGLTATGARLQGTVDPNRLRTLVEFEYYPTGQSDQLRVVEASQSPLTGGQAQSVTARVEDLRPATEYTFRVSANNEGGTRQGNLISFTTPSVSVTHERIPQTPQRGSELTISVTLPDGFSPSEIARLFYRPTGKGDFQSTSFEAADATTYEATIPGSAVTARGVEYYARLSNGSVTVTVPQDNPASDPESVSVQVPRAQSGVELAADEYRMVSVPLRLDRTDAMRQLRDDFGERDRTEWRLLRWDSQEETYREVTAEGETGDFVPGRAFWLITNRGETRDGKSAFDVSGGRSVPAEPIELELSPGWTQIANPRSYPVAWSSVGGRESLMAPVAYDPAATDSSDFNVDVLEAWTGYWVYNPTESTVSLTVPPREAGVESAQSAAASEVRAPSGESEPSMFGIQPSYALQIVGRLDRREASSLRDHQNVVAVAKGAHSGAHPEDIADPPPIGDHLSLSIVEETPAGRPVRLAGSLRPPSERGHTWDLRVATSGAGPRPQTVRGHLQVQGSLPKGFGRRLLDRDTGRPISVESDGTFVLQLTDERSVRHLRLIVGTEGFTESQTESIRPVRTGLRAVYPNPSRGPVSVDYHLKETQQVTVRVYDLLGRTVKTLVDGRRTMGHHTARWNATDVASGMYFVRLRAEGTSAVQRVSVVQ